MILKKCRLLKGEVTVPGDKSISHRAIMLGSIARGTTEIHNFLQGEDCLSTISCFREMGIEIENNGGNVLIHGRGLRGLQEPARALDCGNSGTTTRLISGLLCGQDFPSVITGDASIQKRPMGRIITPLSQMGAKIMSIHGNGCAPLAISGTKLHGISYQSPTASAQVKSAILFAGLYANGETCVTEPALSRDHSERMLAAFGADIRTDPSTAAASPADDPARPAVTIQPADELYGQRILVPGDLSSAAFFIAAGLIAPNSEILLRNVGINPTRSGLLTVCQSMGADIQIFPLRDEPEEPAADILVRSSSLHGTVVSGPVIPTLIDELPVIAALACFADGETVIKDAAELKVKESNRIEAMTENLSAMGADITATDDGMIIRGGRPLHGAVIDSRLDHRIAMTFAVLACCVDGETEIRDAECAAISYPQFYQDLTRLITV